MRSGRVSIEQRKFFNMFCAEQYRVVFVYLTVVHATRYRLTYHVTHTRAAGSNLRMVRPSLMSVVKLLIISARSARQKFGPWYFQQRGGALIALQLQTGILRPGSLVILNVSLMRVHLGTYPTEFYYSNSRPLKCQMRNYVSTLAENGLAMAGPARPVPAPMHAKHVESSIR